MGGFRYDYTTGNGSAEVCLCTAYASNTCSTAAWTGISTSGSSGSRLDQITAATADGTAQDSGAHPIIWDWNSLTTGNGLSLGSTSLTTGSILNISNTNATASTGAALSVSSTAGNAALVVPTGNVGIGTTSPAGILDVEGGTAAWNTAVKNINIVAQSRNGGYGAGGNILLVPGVGSWPGGRVGIGTTSSAGFLDVEGGTSPYNRGDSIILVAQNGATGGNGSPRPGGNIILEAGTGDTGYSTGNIQLLNGDVGIGTTTPGVTLDVAGAIRPGGVTTGASCTGQQGAISYDSTTYATVYCNSSSVWAAGGSATLNGITAATANQNGINSGTYTIVWDWALGGTGGTAFTFGESAASTAAAKLVNIATASGSDTVPLTVTNGATAANPVSINMTKGGLAIGGSNVLYLPDADTSSIAIGYGAAVSQSGINEANTAVGQSVLSKDAGGNYNTGIGNSALYSNLGGQYNTAIGVLALNINTSGSRNVGIGYNVGSTTLTTGSNNILIGTSSAVDTPLAATSNFLNIGNAIFATGMNTGTLSAPAGYVGIGTAAPGVTLDVAGAIRPGGVTTGAACTGEQGAISYDFDDVRHGLLQQYAGVGGSGRQHDAERHHGGDGEPERH